GSALWRSTPGAGLITRPVVDGQLVIVGGSGDGNFSVCALRSDDGQQHWCWESPAGDGGIAGPVAARDRVYVSVADQGIVALAKDSGEVAWRALEGLLASMPAIAEQHGTEAVLKGRRPISRSFGAPGVRRLAPAWQPQLD